MLSKLYKLIFDISVCYTIGAFLLKCIGGISLYSRTFLILLISAGISILLEKKSKLKTLAILILPITSLAFVTPAIPELVVFLFTWAYYSYVSITDRLVIRRGEFIDMLKHTLYLFLLLAFLMLAAFQNFSAAIQVACPYLITAMVSAVFLLRHLRADHQMEQRKQYSRQQFMELLIFLVISILLTLVRAPQNLLDGLKLIYLYILAPIITFFAGILGLLISGIIYLVVALYQFLTGNKELKEIKINLGSASDQYNNIADANPPNADWVLPFAYSIGAILGMVLLFFFFRWLMGEKLKPKTSTDISEIREDIADAKDKKAVFRKRYPKDPRAAVRYYYWKSLLWLQHKKVDLKPQDTTEEINHKYYHLLADEHELKRDSSVQLMQLYRKARYQMTEQVSQEEAETAKELYHTISKLHIKS